MNVEQYETESEDDSIFTFISIGRTKITKIIKFEKLGITVSDESNKSFSIYNLGFGDLNLESKSIDDKVNSNNGDSIIIFNTVLNTIPKFISSKRSVGISIQGSDDKRQRIYLRFLSKKIETFENDFTFYGYKKNTIEPFKKGVKYESIVILPKN